MRKDIDKKEIEYKAIKAYVEKKVHELYPLMKEKAYDQFVKDAIYGICCKFKRGYPISTTTLGAMVHRNDLRQVLNNIQNRDITMVRKLIDIIDRTSTKLEYNANLRVKRERDEEEE